MPIVDIQRRFRELGRLRMGERVAVTDKATGKPVVKDGKPVTRPKKLLAWRLTSPWKPLLEAAAENFGGGEVTPWNPDEGRSEWELYSPSATIPVIVPPGESLTQWYEHWSGGGCDRRCDGARMIVAGGKSSDRACQCVKEGNEERLCRPTSRLVVMLPDLPDLGVWRLETKSWYAASELGGGAALCELATRSGTLIPANLSIEPRRIKRPGQPTKTFAVPILGFRGNLGDTLAALGFGDVKTAPALGAGFGAVEARPALNAGGEAPLETEPTDAREAPFGQTKPVETATLPPPSGGAADHATKDTIDDAELVPPEPPPFVPPAHQETDEGGEPADGGAMPPDRYLALRGRQAGLDDDQRHAVIAIVSRGRTRTGKDLDTGEVARALKVMDGIQRSSITLERLEADRWRIRDSKGVTFELEADGTVKRVDVAGGAA